ncbi:MAG: anti-sigma factor [Sideroxydans sp.]|nr:anti-sigma factor [Sideroxydans sp.]
MKEHISALMDGELFDDEAEALLDKIKRDPAGHEEWLSYHLISDALRQPDHVHADISRSMHERLKDEPTVLAPRSRTVQKVRWFALSAAASVLALAVVAWLSVQVGPEVGPQIAMQQQNNNVRPASMNMDDYLMAHQEFSPSASVEGMTPYIRTVASGGGRQP